MNFCHPRRGTVGDAFLFLIPLPKVVIISARQISSSCRSICHRNPGVTPGVACRRAALRNVPTRSVLESHARKASATQERILTDGGNRVGDRHAREAGAIAERRFINDLRSLVNRTGGNTCILCSDQNEIRIVFIAEISDL